MHTASHCCTMVKHLQRVALVPRNVQKKTRLSVSVTAQEKKMLGRIAKHSDVSVSRVMQEAITEFIRVQPTGKLALFASESRKGK